MTFDKTVRMRDRAELVTVLTQAGGQDLHKRYIRCPFHHDEHASAEIRQAQTSGRWYFYCHRCQIADDVWALQARTENRDVGELLREAQSDLANNGSQSSSKSQQLPKAAPTPEKPPQVQQTPNSRIFETIDDVISFHRQRMPQMVVEEINPYTNPETGAVELYTIRYRPTPGANKKFTQATPLRGGFVPAGISGDKLTPLFNRGRLAEAERVLVVEGEACVRAVTALGIEGLVAVTSPGGAGQASRCDWSPLAGMAVYVWADSDEAGSRYAQEVIAILKKLRCRVYRVREEELELKETGDVIDYLAENKDDPVQAIEMVLHDAEPLGAAKSLSDHLAKVAAGKYKLIAFVNKRHLTDTTQAYLPGTVTVVAGEPESGKSWWILEEAWRQHEAGVPTRLLMLEDDHAFHLRRCLAQMSGEADLMDYRFTEDNIAWAQDLFGRYEERLTSFGSVLEAGGSQERSLFDVADWVEEACASGARLVFIDPITAASTGDISWKDDRKFMMRAKFATEKHGASLILVTHPKLGQAGKPSLGGLAGGASYGRFCHTMLWLKKFSEPETGSVFDGFLSKEVDYVRTINVYKARNGKDKGKITSRIIAVDLNPETLCFEELGMLT